MAVTSEPIYCASTIKLLGVENEVLERLKRPQRKQTRVNVLMALFTKAPTFFVEFIVVATVAIIFIVMARGFGIPYQEAAPLIGAFAIVCSRLLNVLSSLFNMRLNLATIAPSLPLVRAAGPQRMAWREVCATRREALKRIESDIEFRNVSFAYTSTAKQIFSESVAASFRRAR